MKPQSDQQDNLEVEVFVDIFRVIYEGSCSLLTIKPIYLRNQQPIKLETFVKNFWRSKSINKATAQLLVTVEKIYDSISERHNNISKEKISEIVSRLESMGIIFIINVDGNGIEIERILLSPIGLALWTSIDSGPLFTYQKISYDTLQNMLVSHLLEKIANAEKKVWINTNAKRLSTKQDTPFTSELVCFGLYLLVNGAISKEHALYLKRTENKNYEWDKIIVQGLNIIGKSIFDSYELFKVPSLQDVLQRRSELINNVGPSFLWSKPRKNEPNEHNELYWWNILDNDINHQILDHIIRVLVKKILSSTDLTPEIIKDKFVALVNIFRHRIDGSLPQFEMSSLFPVRAISTFDYELSKSIDRVFSRIEPLTMK